MSSVSKKSLKIGLIGAGGNTRLRHAPEFQKIEGVECAVVCNRSEESSQRFATEFGIPHIAKHWREVIDNPDIDAICIGTWPYMHAEIACAALESGKHVLTEARMASSLQEAERMLETSLKYPQLVAQIVPAPMSLGVDAAAITCIQEGKLGNIRQVTAQHLTSHLASSEAPMSWRSDFSYSGVNILSMGILHEIVYRWIGVEPVEVEATAQFVAPERIHFETGKPQQVTIPDTIMITGQYSQGASLFYHFSGAASGKLFGEIRIHGDRGSLRFDLLAARLFYAEVGKTDEIELRDQSVIGDGWQVEKEFVNSIREGKPVLRTSFADGIQYMRFTQRGYESWTKRLIQR